MPDIEGSWSTVSIAGKTADVYEPRNPSVAGRAVLHLHGHGLTTLRDNPAFSAELERHGLRAVCPHGQRSWWTDVVCPEFDPQITPLEYLRHHVVPFFAERWNVAPPGIGLMGISMGGQGALQLAYRHPREFPVVAAISPAVDFHNWHGQGLPLDDMFPTRESARQATVTLQIHPLNWPRHQWFVSDPDDADWHEGADRLAMKLSSMGVPFEADLETRAGGHSWDYFNHMAARAVEFVAVHLDKAGRREDW
jgi:pimeloyl-ACP methyl ester carboxylesterase